MDVECSAMKLTWLPTSWLKGIDAPNITVVTPQSQNYSGYYETGTLNIVVVETTNTSDFLNIVVHEVVHYLQFIRGQEIGKSSLDLFERLPYNKAIRQYFRQDISEYEALVVSNKLYPSETSEFWLNECVLPRKLL